MQEFYEKGLTRVKLYGKMKLQIKREVRNMKLIDIKKNGFYTDGTRVFYKDRKGKITQIGESTKNNSWFLDSGTNFANCPGNEKYNLEVTQIVNGTFCNGEVTISDKKTIELLEVEYIGRKCDSKGYTINRDEIKYNFYKKSYTFADILKMF
jgi:hypothetical protein